MAQKHLASGDAPDGKPLLELPGASCKEPSPSRPFELQHYAPNRVPSPSSQSNVVVPVRLDVLLFLLNAAARAAQYAPPAASVQGGQGAPPICHQGPAAQLMPNCCGCPPPCHRAHQSSGTHQYRGGYGGCGGVTEDRDNRAFQDGRSHRSDGKSWPGGNSAGEQRGGGRGRDNGDNWQGRRQNFGRAWGEQRKCAAGSASWMSRSQEWRREGSAFGSNPTRGKRTQDEGLQPPWDAPDAKRSPDNSRMGWQRSQGPKESTRFPCKPAGGGPAKPAIQEHEEDWDADYESGQTKPPAPGAGSDSSCSDIPTDPTKEKGSASTARSSSPRPLISPLPEEASRAQAVAAAEKPATASCSDASKSGGFLSYLKNLYSDLPSKSGSEDSSELVIDTDVELSIPEGDGRSPEKGTEILEVD